MQLVVKRAIDGRIVCPWPALGFCRCPTWSCLLLSTSEETGSPDSPASLSKLHSLFPPLLTDRKHVQLLADRRSPRENELRRQGLQVHGNKRPHVRTTEGYHQIR